MSNIDELTISWTRDRADQLRMSFRRMFGFVLLAETILAVALIIWPATFAGLTAWPAPNATLWIRAAGVMWLVIGLFQVPGWFDPIYQRWSNIVGLPWRFLLAVLCACLGGFAWVLAVAEFAAAVGLLLLYWRALSAELLCRP